MRKGNAMRLEMIKTVGGVLVPADEMQLPVLQSFKNGEVYEVEIKRSRNPQFHRKVFAFFKFCFDHWAADKTEWAFLDEKAQFDTFRKHLTVLAGYFEKTYTIKGKMRIEPLSLSYGNMEQAEFEQCYSALINAALKHVFKDCKNPQILDRLYAFFW